jgi:CBS domain-containing protein
LAARAYGINTPDITLLPIGGIARLERMPDKPWQELVVALAGPAVNVVIAFGLYLVIGRFFGLGDLEELAEGRGNLLTQLLSINVILVVFNLLPAFPMDGGRVLRALLAMRLSHGRATRIAAAVGQVVAVLFGLLGLFGGNPFLLFIAVFVFFGARAEASFATFKENAEGTHVAAVMRPTGPVLVTGMTVSDAVQAAMQGHDGVLPVADSSLHLVGMIPADVLARALRWDPTAKIDQMVQRDFAAIVADASLSQAVSVMRQSPQAVFPVVNAGGQLVGMLKREEMERALAAG